MNTQVTGKRLYTVAVMLLFCALLSVAGLEARGAGQPSLGQGIQNPSPRPDRPMNLRVLHELAREVTVQIVAPTSDHNAAIGSGVWVSGDVYIATCWHVVKDAQAAIEVRVGIEGLYDLQKGSVFWANFALYKAVVVTKDPDADVAILKVSTNPFKTPPPTFIKTPTREFRARVKVANIRSELPEVGEIAVLAGYPLSRPDLLTQTGNVAGIGLEDSAPPQTAIKGTRVFLSLVSNPANSGGPVLDDQGNLIGLLRGNLPSPVKDEFQRQAVYVRPKRNAAGTTITDQNGRPELEFAPMMQNSGISIVIPAHFVMTALKEAQSAEHHK